MKNLKEILFVAMNLEDARCQKARNALSHDQEDVEKYYTAYKEAGIAAGALWAVVEQAGLQDEYREWKETGE